MIIEIDESIAFSLLSNANNDSISFVEDVSKLRRTGYALIDIKKSTAIRIYSSDNISPLSKAIFRRVSEDVTFNRGAINSVSGKIFYYDSRFLNGREIIDGSNYIDVDGYANVINTLSPPRLVLEDIQDSKVYSAIAKWKLNKVASLANLNVNYIPVHGGGNRTARVCHNEHDNGQQVFAICDSDKKSPNCRNGKTAQAVQAFFESKDIVDRYYVIGVHEVENLIPINVLSDSARETQLPAIRFIEASLSKYEDCFVFYDFKNGFKYNEIYLSDNNISRYWRRIYDEYPGTQDLIRGINGISSDSVLFNKLSSMLVHAIDKMENIEFVNLFPALEREWDNVGDKLISWFIAEPPIRV